ncbi:PBECR2 nuclease fold domain-containing protein [Phytopseudomonas daroniae]|uniref:PBECR2 nuclease fold domain-containing protein n=1 Tax=Phytopseudomonas daroniae TaxID=2487519 RepID=UPI00103852A0|nr:PBECR2 nuclease fold domain-containing protein [Pseudomonas daroniae]TBU75207.1 hypothetical protein DNK10_11160 [Pseudomonas daroniae]
MAVSATSLPFREQNEFLRRKLNLPTQTWTDIYTREHDYAFVVAGANRDGLVQDFRLAVERAIEGGTTLEDFRRDFDRIVAKHGWSYNGGRNWRSRVIYETNMRSSYMAGRYEQLMAVREARPYWQYLHSDAVEHPRLLHESWNGLILRWDDPFWQTHFPINAWGCQCSVRALSQDDLERMGKTGPDPSPAIVMETRTIGQRSPQGPRTVEVPQGIDPGFEYIPGQSRMVDQVPPPMAPPTQIPAARVPDPLPAPQPVPAVPAAAAPGADASVSFLQALGTGLGRQPVIVRDVIGERLVIGPQMISQPVPALPAVNAQLQGQLMANTLLQPDEIWTDLAWFQDIARAVVRRRYVARYQVPGVAQPVTVMLELGANGWWMLPADATQQLINALRSGVLLYVRGS